MENRLFKVKDFKIDNDNEATKTVFYTSDYTSGSVWSVKPGQVVKSHIHTTSDDLWICIQGEGIFYPNSEEEIFITKGDMVLSRANEQHGMKNTGNEDFVFVSVVAPVPSDFVLK
ncbi:MAG: cupin domain-containing protein [Clostridium sp.]|uniref:cupin domain-containing protein n=1 Tax=Clostridium sp. TaxID=1506 RepID=UPI003F32612D